jgi:peptidylprolyl isomerase
LAPIAVAAAAPQPVIAAPLGSATAGMLVAPGAVAAVVQTAAIAGPPSAVLSAATVLADWRPLDPENTLVIDTTKGRVVVELRPEFAPVAVMRIKRLARSKVYDGLQFHRVIQGFIAQTGNPNNTDGGKSAEPDIPPEFTFRLGAEIPRTIAARPQGETEGFIGVSAYQAVDEMRMALSPDRRVTAWGAQCAGVMAMGHDDADMANSEFYFMLQTTRSNDRRNSVVGRIVMGLDIVQGFAFGDPPGNPDRMLRARILADLPDLDRPAVLVLNTLSPRFTALVQQVRAVRGPDFSVCDVEVPVMGSPSAPRVVEADASGPKRKSKR